MSANVWQNEGVVSDSSVEFPGTTGVIECGSKISSSMSVVTTAASANTVQGPETGGQQFFVYMETDGGDAVLTFPTNFDGTNNTFTLNTAADFGLFISVATSTGFKWFMAINSGAGVSAV